MRALAKRFRTDSKKRSPALRKGQKFTKETIAKTLRKNGGFISYTARALGCHENTVRNYVKKYPDLEEIIEEAREGMVDLAEASLVKQVQGSNTIATIFLLKCLGKKRGYVEAPQQHLHAHMEAGAGTWVDIVKRVVRDNGGKDPMLTAPQLLAVSAEESPEVIDAELENGA